MLTARRVALRVNGVPMKRARIRHGKGEPELLITHPHLGEFPAAGSFFLELVELVHPDEIRRSLPNGSWRRVSLRILVSLLENGRPRGRGELKSICREYGFRSRFRPRALTSGLPVARASPEHLASGFPQRVYRSFRDHAPISPGERTTPFEATTSSLIRCARLERSTSVALAIFNFSITGKRLLITSATSSYAG